MKGFREKLAKRQLVAETIVCVGLDPLEEKIPKFLLEKKGITPANAFEIQMVNIAFATAKSAMMFKPQVASWLAVPGGFEALHRTVARIHEKFPDIPVILDFKCGDIARTQKQYGVASFKVVEADGVNFSPYMGRDCMAALVDKENIGRALVGLCYTSNPDAREIQDLILDNDCRLWEFIAKRTLAWAKELGVVENAGLVMAAAYETVKGSGIIYSEHLVQCRRLVGDNLWYLIPGIGTQGGYISETVGTAYTSPGSIAINSSSDIDFASSGEDYAEAAGEKACELCEKTYAAIPA